MTTRKAIRQMQAERRLSHARWAKDSTVPDWAWLLLCAVGLVAVYLARIA